MGWMKAARLIQKALTKTIKSRIVTYDFARQMKGAKEVKTSEFARAIVKNMS
jgi:isocitrate dehydrogenase